MRNKNFKRVLKKEGKSASCCCKSAETIKTDQSSKEDVFRMKRKLGEKDESASYCCEAAGTLSVEELPPEDAY